MLSLKSCDPLLKAPFAFAVHEITGDKQDKNLSLFTVKANPGYRHLLSLSAKDDLNKTDLFYLSSVFSDREYWLELFYRAAYEGAVHDNEYLSAELNCWLHVNVYQVEVGFFATVIMPLNTNGSRSVEADLIFKVNPDMVCVHDYDGFFYKINPAFETVLGGDITSVSDKTIYDYILLEDIETTRHAMDNLRQLEPVRNFINRYQGADNKLYYFEWNAISDEKYVYAIARDITERFEQQEKLERLTLEKDIIFNSSQTAMFLMEAGSDGQIRYIRDNLANQQLFAPICANITGKSPCDVFGEKRGQIVEDYCRQCLQEVKPLEYDFQINLNYETVYLQISLTPVFFDQDRIFIVGSIIDLTQEKKTQQKISFLSFHDQLTGLYNRHFYEEEVYRLDRERNLPLAVIQADVNGLKLTNDAFGHTTGDRLIKAAANVLKDACRADDIVARLGGDEFIVLLPKTDHNGVEAIVTRMREKIDECFIDSIPLSISLGWAVKKDMREDIADIMKQAEDYMYRRKLNESPEMRSKTVQSIMSRLSENCIIEKSHSENVGKLAVMLGREYDLPDSDLSDLYLLGQLHDIGKIDVDPEIINKPDVLNEDEWIAMKKHPEVGYRILSTVNDLAEIADYVLAHHERWDGTGYPRRLAAYQIPLQSRIIAIADAYDAMTSPKPYRKALSKEEAIEELKKAAGMQLDPDLTVLFIDALKENNSL